MNRTVRQRRNGRRKRPNYVFDYPPDDGYSNNHWSRNVVCVPCRYATRYAGWLCHHPKARQPERCPTCQSPLMAMPFTFSVPRKQDKWWTSKVATSAWTRHLADIRTKELAREAHEVQEAPSRT